MWLCGKNQIVPTHDIMHWTWGSNLLLLSVRNPFSLPQNHVFMFFFTLIFIKFILTKVTKNINRYENIEFLIFNNNSNSNTYGIN